MSEPKRNRQCGLGWHDECTDPLGDFCECECHPWILRNDPAEILASAANLDGAEVRKAVPVLPGGPPRWLDAKGPGRYLVIGPPARRGDA